MQENPYKIYNASAGSGKTFTLVKEYLKIVLAPHSDKSFRQILAITFTNKAVNEMKQRILKSLFEFSQVTNTGEIPPLFSIIAEELRLEPESLRKKSKKLLKEILHNYAFFDISTIDKFTYRLIRTFAKDLKLPQNFEVVLDTDLLLDEAVGRLISKAGSDKKLTEVLIDFALEKIDEDKSWDVTMDLNKIGKLLFDENHANHLKKLENKKIDDFLELKELLRDRISVSEKEILNHAAQILNTIDSNGLEFGDFKSSYFPKFIFKIDQGDLNIDFKANWKQNFGQESLYNKSCPDAIRLKLDTLLPKFNSSFQAIKLAFYHRSFLKNAYNNLVPLTVLNAIHQELRALEMERDQLPISSFNTIISNEIKNQPAPFIYERLGEKYRHYFVDEFQDTSQLQWNNLIPLIGNALESEDEQSNRGSLLLVGDAKQAIYRWRGGRAEQFLNLINLTSNPFVILPDVQNLPSNYRSHEEVIKFNNDFFTVTSPFLNNELYHALFTEGNRQKFNAKKGGLVQLDFIEEHEKTLDETYCERVLDTLQEVLGKSYEYRDICILTRKRRHGILLSDFLMRNNIPIISSETLLLNGNDKVKFLINLLRYSSQPQDLANRYDILYYLAVNEDDRHHFIEKNIGNLHSTLLDKYNFDFDNVQQASVYDSLEYAIKQFGLAENSDAYMTYLMDEVLEVEQKKDTGIAAFLEYWEKKKNKLSIVAPTNMNAVHIMTIHKAKGLEFPIVIFPFANSNIYEEIDPKLWLSVKKGAFKGFEELLTSKKQEVLHYGEKAEILYTEEQHKLELDAFNLLYVALTRCISGLYVITQKDINSKGEHNPSYYSGLFIYYLKERGQWEDNKSSYSFGELNLKDREHQEVLQENVPYPYTRKNSPSFRILTNSGMLWDTNREEAISKGNLIHYLMGLIETYEDIENAVMRLLNTGDIGQDETDFLRRTIEKIIYHPQLHTFFKKGLIIKNESDIIAENGLILRPDRLVIKAHKVTIMDYKTGKKNPHHHQQLFAYADALTAMGYIVENKIIVYIDNQVTAEFI